MKTIKNLLLVLCTALLLTSCGGEKYKIMVSFADDSMNGKVAYLTSYDSGDTLQQATVANRNVVLEGDVENSYYAHLIVGGKLMGFMVEKGEISINWDKGEVSGTALNDALKKIYKQIDDIETEAENMSETLKMSQQVADSIMSSYYKKEGDVFYRAYEANKDNGLGQWAFYNYLMYQDFTEVQLDSVIKLAPASYKDLKLVQKAKSDAHQLAITAEGKMFTDFTIMGDDGKSHKLSDHVGKGSYTLVDFWASWCGPCRREIPNIKKLYDQYNGKGMNFLGVAVWDAPADSRAAIKQLGMPWPVMVGNKKLDEPTNIYGIMGIPHIIIFDAQGKIVSRGLMGDELTAKVNQLMAKK